MRLLLGIAAAWGKWLWVPLALLSSPSEQGSWVLPNEKKLGLSYFRFGTRAVLTRGAHNKSPSLAWPVGRHFGRFSSWGLGRHHHSLSAASFSSGWVRDLLHWGCSHEQQSSGDDSLATGAQRSESLLLLPWGVCFESFLLLLLENPIKIQRLAKLGIFFQKHNELFAFCMSLS